MSKQKTRIMHNGKDIVKERKNLARKISTYLVFDIETISDTEMIDLVGKDKDKEKLECMRRGDQNGENGTAQNTFLLPHFHHIVAVSTLIIKPHSETPESRHFSVDLTAAYGAEKDLVRHFWQRFRDAMLISTRKDDTGENPETIVNISSFPCLVSFNGKSFDMPAIVARTLKHFKFLNEYDRTRIALYHDSFDTWENTTTNYRHRYTKYHVDLCWEMTGSSISLAAACHLAGIPAKTEMDGKNVWKAYQEGKQQEIARYCAEDVLATAQLFSVWNEVFLGSRYNFPARDELSDPEPKVIEIT